MQIGSTLAFVDAFKLAWKQFFEDPCPTCFGAGTVTCDRCFGTKTLQSRPARLIVTPEYSRQLIIHRAQDAHQCWQCGPNCKYDFDMTSEDINDEVDATCIRKNLQALMSGKPRPFPFEPTAGMIVCRTCYGSKMIKRTLPNYLRVAGLTSPLFPRVCFCTKRPVHS
jgi:hypothetical protein